MSRPYESKKPFNRLDNKIYKSKLAYEIKCKNNFITWTSIGERLGMKPALAKKNALSYAMDNNLSFDF